MCNKCENFHTKLCQNHTSYKIDKDSNEIDSKICQIKEHNNNPLEFFCKDHNQLCCVSCICKIEEKGKGQHKDCNVCVIEDIKEEKKNSLSNDIQKLANLSENLEDNINKMKLIYENMNKKKEDLKLKVMGVFTKIRNFLSEREDKLLLEIDKKYKLILFNDEEIKDNEKLPKKIKYLLEKGKKVENESKNEKNINIHSIIINCINIEQAIKKIKTLKESIENNENTKQFELEFVHEYDLNVLKESIQKFGTILSHSNLINYKDRSILKDNYLFISGLKEWNKNVSFELLFKKSRDGNSYKTFHDLCDNKGETLILIKSSEGFIIGGYTPLEWDSNSGWKNDDETFLFSVTTKKIFKKKGKYSIYCGAGVGPWFAFIGFRGNGKKDMTQAEFLYKKNEICFENFNEIIPNENKDKFFGVDEVEIYKIIY